MSQFFPTENIPGFCQEIIEEEGGESRSERAKQAKSLILLFQGWVDNHDRILPDRNNSVTMQQFQIQILTTG